MPVARNEGTEKLFAIAYLWICRELGGAAREILVVGRLVGFGRLCIHQNPSTYRFYCTVKNVRTVFHRQKRLLWDTDGTRRHFTRQFPPYPHPHSEQPFPRTVSTPSLAMIGTITSADTGSAHH